MQNSGGGLYEGGTKQLCLAFHAILSATVAKTVAGCGHGTFTSDSSVGNLPCGKTIFLLDEEKSK